MRWLLGIVGLLAALGVLYVTVPRSLLANLGLLAAPTETSDGSVCAGRQEACDFAAAVLGSLEEEWRPLVEGGRLRADGGGETNFDTPTLAVFGAAVTTGCGAFETDFGPFYCNADRTFYLDFVWLDELWQESPGDFGQAIMIAHEYAHWLQEKSGVAAYVREIAAQNPRRARELSVRFELQADCLAGVWGALAREQLAIDDADLREGMNVASFIGNDAAQRRAGYIVDAATFTHGSSEQRIRWMRRGFESGGEPLVCDTISPEYETL